RRSILRQLDHLVYTADGVVDRNLKNRAALLDREPGFFGSLVGPVSRLGLPINLEPKLTLVGPLALAKDLRRGLGRVGYHSYRLLTWRHVMSLLGLANGGRALLSEHDRLDA